MRLGVLHLGPASPGALLAPVRRMLLSPDYSEDRARGDLALLQLHRPVPLSSRVQPVCLPEPRAHLPPGTLCWVTGWGSLHPGGEAEVGHSGTRGEPVSPSTPCRGIPPPTASPWDPLVTQTSSQSFRSDSQVRLLPPIPCYPDPLSSFINPPSSPSATPRVATSAGSKGAIVGFAHL